MYYKYGFTALGNTVNMYMGGIIKVPFSNCQKSRMNIY